MFEDVKNQMASSSAPNQPNVAPQAAPINFSATKPTPNQLANFNATAQPKRSSHGKLLAILVIFILVLGIAGLGFWYWQNNKEQIRAVLLPLAGIDVANVNFDLGDPFASSTEPDVIISTSTPTSTAEGTGDGLTTIGELFSDYRQSATWPVLLTCYMAKHPEANQYFPAGKLRDQYTVATSSAGLYDEDKDYMGNSCDLFSQEAYDFALSMLKTDVDKDNLNLFLESIYHTSDAKVDTDGDTYSDLTEVLTGHEPNDVFINQMKDKMSQVENLLGLETVDFNKALAICSSMEAPFKDTCLLMVAGRSADSNFCKTAGFSPYYTYQSQCEDELGAMNSSTPPNIGN